MVSTAARNSPEQETPEPSDSPTPQFAVVGLVGGVGSGKSTITEWVAERGPISRVDGDRIGHAVLRLPFIKQQLVKAFGSDILDAAGEVNRQRLGQQVWGNSPEQLAARQRLEAIVHPSIREEIHHQIEAARTTGKWGVLLDAAVMLETGWAGHCDRLIFLNTPEALRRDWVVRQRGWTEQQWRERENSQWDLERKRQRADFILDNTGDLQQTGENLMTYLQREFRWWHPTGQGQVERRPEIVDTESP